MIYALIAAGEGSRLSADGVAEPKPLVRVNGTPLLKRLFDIFIGNDAEEICVIINDKMTAVRSYLEGLTLPVPLHVIVKSTPDSFCSFCELAPLLNGAERFCLTTVDPIFREQEFTQYIREFAANESCDALMAVTGYIDDESPLYVKTDDALRITGYANSAYAGCRYISGGVYCLSGKALSLLPKAIETGVHRMRGFQQFLVDEGLSMRAYPFTKVIDIDHAEDIAKAEALLNE